MSTPDRFLRLAARRITDGNDHSVDASITDDGRYTVFYSGASNLAAGTEPASSTDVLMWDRETEATTRLVPVGPDEGASNPKISSDGQYVAYGFSYGNPSPGENQLGSTVHLVNRATGQSWRVQGENQYLTDMSSDGRYLAYSGFAEVLMSNGMYTSSWAVFVWDRVTGITDQVFPKVSSGTDTDVLWEQPTPQISDDGRFVVFAGQARFPLGIHDIFVHDRALGTTEYITRPADSGDAEGAVVSGDGRTVVFTSTTENSQRIFSWDRETKTITPITDGAVAENVTSVSSDARFISYASTSRAFAGGLDRNKRFDLFLWDRVSGSTTRITTGNNASGDSQLSENGQHMAFSSEASNLAPGDTNDASDIFVWDRMATR